MSVQNPKTSSQRGTGRDATLVIGLTRTADVAGVGSASAIERCIV